MVSLAPGDAIVSKHVACVAYCTIVTANSYLRLKHTVFHELISWNYSDLFFSIQNFFTLSHRRWNKFEDGTICEVVSQFVVKV